MKLKFLPLLAGVVALTVGATALTVSAQTPRPDGSQRLERMREELNLTEAQTQQLEQLHSNKRSQMQNVLTAEQQQALETAIAQGQNPREAMRSLNLSEEQREQLRSIKEASREQMQNILTEEQRQQLRERREARRGQFRPGRSQQ